MTDNRNGQQAWLALAYEAIRRDILPEAPANAVVSYGFPTKGAVGGRTRTLGQCLTGGFEHDKGASLVLVSPVQWTCPAEVLHVLVHEAIHAAYPEAGHKGAFAKAARAVGLEGKLTATVAGAELAQRLETIAAGLPEFPAAGYTPTPRGSKGSRLRLYECGGCEKPVKVRVASDDFDARCNVCLTDFQYVPPTK